MVLVLVKHRGGVHADLQLCALCVLCGFLIVFLACVFRVGGFWDAPDACELITPSYYNICVHLRLSAVEIKKINRRCTQMHADTLRVGFD